MEENVKLKWRERLCYGSGQAGSVVLNQLLATFLLSYYTDTLLINAAAISTMFLVTRFLDGITDFIVGALMDKTNTRFGKARPWLLADAPLMALGIALMFIGNAGWSDGGKLLYAYVTYIFSNCIAYTIWGIGHGALLAKITMNVGERTTLSSVSMFLNNVVVMIVGAIVTPMVMALGWKSTSIILGIAAGILIFLEFAGTKERVNAVKVENPGTKEPQVPFKEQLKKVLVNKYFWMIMIINMLVLLMNANSIQSMIYYCNYVLKNPMFISVLMSVGGIPSILVMFFIPALSKRFSKRTVLAGSSVLLLISFLIMGFAGANQTLVFIGVTMKNLAVSPMFGLPMALLADIVDYNEYKTGFRCEGLISTSSSIGMKIGIGFGAALTGWILAFSGYDGAAAVQSAKAVSGIKFSFSWTGVIFSILILIAVLFIDIEKKIPEVHAALDKKHKGAKSE